VNRTDALERQRSGVSEHLLRFGTTIGATVRAGIEFERPRGAGPVTPIRSGTRYPLNEPSAAGRSEPDARDGFAERLPSQGRVLVEDVAGLCAERTQRASRSAIQRSQSPSVVRGGGWAEQE
jgi:hypothetical protein